MTVVRGEQHTPALFESAEPPAEPKQASGEAEPSEETGLFADVALNRPMRCEYTYRVPPELAASLAPGMRVSVPFARKREVAVVVGLTDTTDVPRARLKSIYAVLDAEPVVAGGLLELTRWMANYYACSWGEALAAVLPAALKSERGMRQVLVASAAEGVGAEELRALEADSEKQHRLLRTLIEIGGRTEVRDILRRLNLSDSPLKTLERKGLVRLERVAAPGDALLEGPVGQERQRPEELLPEQAAAVGRIGKRIDEGDFGCFLLHGVTGSGKTEVYLRVIERALAAGKTAIVLVPEIALTPQTVGWFRSRFEKVAVLHSRMTDAQRMRMWLELARGTARVVVGARSAVFAPVSNLGVIVVDEEHEPSFKQGNTPRYHARDVAVVRAKNAQAVCVLGSATPSLESLSNAERGRYEKLELRRRVHGGAMPRIEIVDMRGEKPEPGMPTLFSRRLRSLLSQALQNGEQSILFLNRRGFSPVLWCRECGDTVRCRQCSVALNFHRHIRRAVCHSCCEEIQPPKECPTCTAPAVVQLGVGSERVEDSLQQFLPDARVARMDSDTMLRREDYERTLADFGSGELDVLVGTQMIAKGLDFPRVTVVGIISADAALHLPDFRAAERTYQLISQVAGRAGRGDLEGHIVVQTVTPEHPAIVEAARHDYAAFAGLEDRLRAELGYPPHGKLIRVVFEDQDEQRVLESAARVASILRERLTEDGVFILGPAPAPLALLRGRHRHHILVKANAAGTGLALARTLLVRLATESARPRVSIDIDPVGML